MQIRATQTRPRADHQLAHTNSFLGSSREPKFLILIRAPTTNPNPAFFTVQFGLLPCLGRSKLTRLPSRLALVNLFICSLNCQNISFNMHREKIDPGSSEMLPLPIPSLFELKRKRKRIYMNIYAQTR